MVSLDIEPDKPGLQQQLRKLRQRVSMPALVFAAMVGIAGSLTVWRSFAANPNMPADLNNDNVVDLVDLAWMLDKWGSANTDADLNHDGTVELADLSFLLNAFNTTVTPPPPQPPSPPPPTSEVASESQCPNQSSATASSGQQQTALLCMLGIARLYHQLPATIENSALMQAAAAKAADINSCEFSHTACGRAFDYWIKQNGYTGKCYGENIAEGYRTTRDVFVAWLNSPSHRANILRSSYIDAGVARLNGANNTIIWVQHFGGCH